MARNAVRFYPRVRLHERPKPAHPPFLWDAFMDALREQTNGTLANGRVTNIVFNRIHKDEFVDFDGMPGMPSKVRPAVATLKRDIEWVDTDVYDWIHVPTDEEKAARVQDKAELQTKLEKLEKIQEPSDTDKEQITTIRAILDQLADSGMGYKRTSYNSLGTKASGLFWGLAAPNVPVALTSAFTLDADRGVSFRLKRKEAPDEQANYEYSIEIGNSSTSTQIEGNANNNKGKTLYAIVIGSDGNSCDFVHYRNMTTARREKLLADLNAILDAGRQTVDDRKQILELETKLQVLEATRRNRDGDKKLTTAESLEKERIKDEIEKIKSKKLNAFQESERRRLEELLYIAREPFKLQEKTNDLINKSVDFSVEFLNSGFVVVSSEDSRFIYENKAITGAKPAQYATMLPKGSYITLRSDGGEWDLVYGHPVARTRGSIWSQTFQIPFAFSNNEVLWNYDGYAAKPGCSIDFQLVPVQAPRTVGTGASATYHPGWYQVRIDLRSDVAESEAENGVLEERFGEYSPELSRAELYIKGAPVPEVGPAVWDSQIHGARQGNSGNCIKDVVIQDDRERSLNCEVVVDNSGDGAGLPLNLASLACYIELYDRDNDVTIPVANFGKIVEQPMTGVNAIGADEDGFFVDVGVGSEISFQVVGPEAWLSVPILAPVVGNNKLPNDHWREMVNDAGLPPSAYTNVLSGDIGLKRIERVQPGKFPDCKPGFKVTYLEYLRDLVIRKHCPGYDQWSDGQGLRIAKHSFRHRPELNFRTVPDVPASSPLCLRGKHDGSSRPVWRQDLRQYYTGATFIGAIDPLTGIRYSATETIPEATEDPSSMFFVGQPNHYTAEVDDSLRSNAACLKAAREFLHITPHTPKGLPPYFCSIEVDLDPTIRAGDLVYLFGIKCLVDVNDFSALNDGDGQRSKLGLRLAEDKQPE